MYGNNLYVCYQTKIRVNNTLYYKMMPDSNLTPLICNVPFLCTLFSFCIISPLGQMPFLSGLKSAAECSQKQTVIGVSAKLGGGKNGKAAERGLAPL